MKKKLSTLLLLSFLWINGSAQKVAGFFPDWVSAATINNVQFTKLTDIYFAFTYPDGNGNLQTTTANSANNILQPLTTRAHQNGTRIHISAGGAASSGNFSATVGDANRRQNFVNSMANYIQTYNLDGINIDWEFPGGGDATNLALLMQEIRTRLNQLEGTMGKELELSIAVGPLLWNTDGINTTTIGLSDFIFVMAFDASGNCCVCGGEHHSTLAVAENSLRKWTTGLNANCGNGTGKNAPASKLVLSIPFYTSDPYQAYNTISNADPATYFNDADGLIGGNDYNSCPVIQQKTDLIMNTYDGAGIWTWELSQDRNDQYSLVSCMYDAMQPYLNNNNQKGPYNNVAQRIPGRIELEKYDNGGEGQGYHDNDVNNSGNTYRTNGVDIEACTDAGTGYNIGWVANGEWLEYTVNVQNAMNYDFIFRSASANGGGRITITIDGNTVINNQQLPVTGGWQTWQNTTFNNIPLTKGNHLLRVIFGTGNVNANYVDVLEHKGAYNNTAQVIPGIVQAERFDNGGEGRAYHDVDTANRGGAFRSSGVDIEACTDAGTGYNLSYVSTGEWLEYSINVQSTGIYDFRFRSASQITGGNITVTVDGNAIISNLDLPVTGAWQTWQNTFEYALNLTQGNHTLRIYFNEGDVNLNYVDIQPSIYTSVDTEVYDPSMLHLYPNPSNGKVNIKITTDENYELSITNSEGKTIYQKQGFSNTEIILENTLASGIYFVNVKTENKIIMKKLVLIQ